MPREIKLQPLGENLEGGKVLEVKVSPGSSVSAGQTLLEVEAEKATLEVPAPEAGKVTQVLVKKGDDVVVGQTLLLLENGKDASSKPPTPQPAGAMKTAAPAQPVPPAPTALPPPPQAKPAPSVTTAPVRPSGDGMADDKPVPAGPATRRLARELGIDLHLVKGSAAHGRIVEEDVKAYVRQVASGQAHGGPGTKAPPLPDFERWGAIERRPLEQVRRRTAEHLSLAWQLIPHVTQHDQCDITELDAFRRQQEGKGEPGVKLTVTAFAAKAAAIALREFPQFNSSIDMTAGQLIVKKYIHIGIAVDTDRGLLVPVLRNVDHLSVDELARQLPEIADKARQKKLTADEMRGGTFTITNLGGIGGTAFTPIINYPEVAILGMSRARLQPVVRDGQVVPRLILTLSLSYDHRVIDGADGARFVRRVCDMLENPLKMLLHA
jgi:pyruvate dehydrogenase E2 component (dihydrolipoamide acetyltransferase)